MGQTDYSKTDVEYPVSKDQFRFFRSRVLYWAKRFSLNEWEWFFELRADKDARACVFCDCEGRIVTVRLAGFWEGVKPTKGQLDLVAFHEVCEVMIAPLKDCARSRWTTEREVDVANHTIIRRLENLVLGKPE